MKKLCFKKKQNTVKGIAIFTILWYYNSAKGKGETNMKTYDYKREGKTRRTYTFRIWEGRKVIAVCEGIDGNDIPEVCEALKAEGYTER